jgi:hypothetical protein
MQILGRTVLWLQPSETIGTIENQRRPVLVHGACVVKAAFTSVHGGPNHGGATAERKQSDRDRCQSLTLKKSLLGRRKSGKTHPTHSESSDGVAGPRNRLKHLNEIAAIVFIKFKIDICSSRAVPF